jgi:signal transduction histidine kinase
MSTLISQIGPKREWNSTGIAMAIHDLKGSLAVIAGQAKLLRAGKLGPLTAEQAGALADVVLACHQMEEKIARLLSPQNKVTLECRPAHQKADLRKCVLDTYSLLRGEFAEQGLEFEVDVSELPLVLPFDPVMVRQVMLNLLENARRFTPRGGRVKMTLSEEFWERRNSRFRAAFEGRYPKTNLPNCAQVTITDSGCGIAAENLERVFEEYFTTPAPGFTPGSGLGLAIAKRIVSAHAGKIWAESEAGAGSTFSFRLPFVPPFPEAEFAVRGPGESEERPA